jgi:hypothetical protein
LLLLSFFILLWEKFYFGKTGEWFITARDVLRGDISQSDLKTDSEYSLRKASSEAAEPPTRS